MPAKTKTRPEAEILHDLLMLHLEYDPENLYMDGEASPEQVRRTLARLNRIKAKLEAELGRTPSDQELWANAR